MRTLALIVAFLAIASSPLSADAEETEVILTDYAYYVDGNRSEDYKSFATYFEKHRETTVSISSCSCLDTARFIEFMDWLRELGVENLALSVIDESIERSLCIECN